MSSDIGSSLEKDPRGQFLDRHGGAVLLADEIGYFSTSDRIPVDQRLIDPFEPERLRAASYQLTLGNQVHVGGRHHVMQDSKPLILEPHQVAVVSTRGGAANTPVLGRQVEHKGSQDIRGSAVDRWPPS